MFTKPSMEKEAEANDLVRALDPTHNFTVRVIETCEADLTLADDTLLQSCNRSMTRASTPMQIVSEYGGESLLKKMKSMPGSQVSVVLHGFHAILTTGLVRLAEVGLVHRDIKPDNILWHSSSAKCLLIDFGIACAAEKVFDRESNKILDHEYAYYPMEFRFVRDVVTGGQVSFSFLTSSLGRMARTYVISGSQLTIAMLAETQKADAAFQVLAKPLDPENLFVRLLSNKVDVFSVGVTMLEVGTKLHSSSAYTLELCKTLMLAVAMIDPCVFRRPSPFSVASLWAGVEDAAVTLDAFTDALLDVLRFELSQSIAVLPELALMGLEVPRAGLPIHVFYEALHGYV